jgi:ribonuclease III
MASALAARAASGAISRSQIEAILHMRVNDMALYREAFTHKSAVREQGVSSERLELLGDAVVNLVVGEFLLNTFKHANEGFVSRARTRLVSGKQMALYASALGLGQYVIMSSNARIMGIEYNDRILEDVFEALVGALYADMGFDAARSFVLRIVETHADMTNIVLELNYKDLLNRHVQRNGLGTVEYTVENTTGPAHKREYLVGVSINGKKIASAVGQTKKDAEMNAAHQSLQAIGVSTTQLMNGLSG